MSDDDNGVVVDPKTAEIRAPEGVFRFVGPGDRWEVDLGRNRYVSTWSTWRVEQVVGAQRIIRAVAGIGREDYAAVLAGLLEVDVGDVLPRVAP